jgi:hypothetical protein
VAGPKKGLREALKRKRNLPGKTRERRREKSGTTADNETSSDIALHRIGKCPRSATPMSRKVYALLTFKSD